MSEPDAESDDATAHAAAFQRDGFCVVPSLIPAVAAADARHRSAQLWTTRHAAAEWLMAAHQLNQPSPQAWIRDIALAPCVGRLVSAIPIASDVDRPARTTPVDCRHTVYF